MKWFKLKWLYLIVFVVFILLGFSLDAEANTPKLANGRLDLSEWDLNHDGNLNLDGPWEFYWDRLLNYQDLQAEKAMAE